MEPDLIQMFEAGVITSHEAAVESLNRLDPLEPESVLAHLPEELLTAVHDFVDQYQPKTMLSVPSGGTMPSEAQVAAAAEWIADRRANRAPSQSVNR